MENFMSAFNNSNNNNNKDKISKKIDKDQLDKIIAVSSEEIHFIDRDIEIAKNNFKDTKTLELQKGITVFTTIASAIEKSGQEKIAFELLSGSISNSINGNDKKKIKENLLNHFNNNAYKDIKLTVSNEEKTLSEFVSENFDSMCNFFKNTYGKDLPSSDSLKKLGEFRITTSYLTNDLAEDILKGLTEATKKEDDCKSKTEKHKEIKKEINENKELTKDNTKTIVKCALGFGAAGLAVAFPPLLLVSAFFLIFDNAKDKEGHRTLPFGDIVGAAVELTKTVLEEIDQATTGQVNKFKNEKENEKDEKFNKIIDENKKFSEEIRKNIGELSKDKAIEILKDMNITEENFKTIDATLGIKRYGKHQFFSETLNGKNFLENTKKEIENKVQIYS